MCLVLHKRRYKHFIVSIVHAACNMLIGESFKDLQKEAAVLKFFNSIKIELISVI